MTRSAFRQADIERIIRAAEKTSSVVQVDLRSLVVTIFPNVGHPPKPMPPLMQAPDGTEDWSDIGISMHRGAGMPPEPIEPPLDHREQAILERLAALGVGKRHPSGGIRLYGPSTQSKLLERGYIDVFHQEGGKFVDDEVCLTSKGMADWKKLKKFLENYSFL